MNCYNGEQYLEEAIRSVLNQTYKNWELIFWDNQSTDRSAEIATGFHDPRIRYLLAPEHTPLGLARRLALAQATGEWIGFLDVDDLWMPRKIQLQLEAARSHTGKTAGLVYGRAVLFGSAIPEGERDYHWDHFAAGTPLPSGDVLHGLLTRGNFIPMSSVLISRAAYDATGGFSPEFVHAPDYALWCDINAVGFDVCAVQEIVTHIRMHESNATRTMWREAVTEDFKVLKRFPDVPGIGRRVWHLRKELVRRYLQHYAAPLWRLYVWLRRLLRPGTRPSAYGPRFP